MNQKIDSERMKWLHFTAQVVCSLILVIIGLGAALIATVVWIRPEGVSIAAPVAFYSAVAVTCFVGGLLILNRALKRIGIGGRNIVQVQDGRNSGTK